MFAVRCGASIVVACVLAAIGCSSEPPLGTASGRVTYRGNPVKKGVVEFSDGKSGLAYVAPLADDGSFKFQVARGHGLPPAAYVVSIGPPRVMPGLGYIAPDYSTPNPVDIPKKYRDPKSSGFTAEVAAGENAPFVFDME